MQNDSTSLVSFTLTGRAEPIIHDALRSVVPLVDACLAIWTGADPRPLGWAPDAVGEAGPDRRTVYHREWPWRGDFGAARNAALDLMADLFVMGRAIPPNAWGVMLDDDERAICPDPAAFRAWLASLPAHVAVVCVRANDGTHTRERFFRMPSRYRFVGRTHEMYACPEDEQAIAPPALITWSELPKTREQLRTKFLRDVDMLRADIIANPKNGAAHYYLGDSLRNLALFAREDGNEAVARLNFLGAIESFREHRSIDTSGAPAWHEGTAFSCYRAAECFLALGENNRAIDCAVAGLALDAGIAELYWIASVASLNEGRHEQARAWAESAKVHGAGSASERRRKGFRIPRALTTGPDEVLAAVASVQTIEGTVGFVRDERTDLDRAWDRVFALFGLHDKPRSESPLGLARDGHPNAFAIVRNELKDTECDTCGALENCAAARPVDFERREALRDLLRAMGEIDTGIDPSAKCACEPGVIGGTCRKHVPAADRS